MLLFLKKSKNRNCALFFDFFEFVAEYGGMGDGGGGISPDVNKGAIPLSRSFLCLMERLFTTKIKFRD